MSTTYKWRRLTSADAIEAPDVVAVLEGEDYTLTVIVEDGGFAWYAWDNNRDEMTAEDTGFDSSRDAKDAAEFWLEGVGM